MPEWRIRSSSRTIRGCCLATPKRVWTPPESAAGDVLIGMEQASSTPDLLIIIPALNEAGHIGPLVSRCRGVIQRLGVSAEIIVVDGGSSDTTVAEAEQAGGRVISQVGRGYGGALRTGFGAARGRHIQTMDSDLSHEPEVIQSLWEARDRADVVIASRYVKGGSAEMPRFRAVLSRILNVTFTTAFRMPVHDISSGFRLYRAETLKRIAFHASDF